jgi:hypothetical protein
MAQSPLLLLAAVVLLICECANAQQATRDFISIEDVIAVGNETSAAAARIAADFSKGTGSASAKVIPNFVAEDTQLYCR